MTSLRDTKRAETSAALALASLRLASERGLDGFTTDDIVTEVGCSRRTFANYYSCKEEAVVAAAFLGFGQLDRLLARMPHPVPLDVLVDAVERLPESITDAFTANNFTATAKRPTPAITRAEFIDGIERVVLAPVFMEMFEAGGRLAPLIDRYPTIGPFALAQHQAMMNRIEGVMSKVDGLDLGQTYVDMFIGAVAGCLGGVGIASGLPTPDGTSGAICRPGTATDALRRERITTAFDYLRYGFASNP